MLAVRRYLDTLRTVTEGAATNFELSHIPRANSRSPIDTNHRFRSTIGPGGGRSANFDLPLTTVIIEPWRRS